MRHRAACLSEMARQFFIFASTLLLLILRCQAFTAAPPFAPRGVAIGPRRVALSSRWQHPQTHSNRRSLHPAPPPALQSSSLLSSRARAAEEVPSPSARRRSWRLARKILDRFNILQSAGLDERQVLTAGLCGKLKKLHDPITYFCLGILAGFRWDWCFRSPVYWFAIGFTIKWYRARYVFKIPVWDRQPNWNNIITSKDQERNLKALTCKNCGSTIFIAKTREFFFEGNTGIGGLGCFACGAKGKENFIQDRDRIVEDVGDMDDYFEYERPLDFVSRAERRKLLKEAQGDEEKANQLLMERTGSSPAPPPANNTPSDFMDAEIESAPAPTEPASTTGSDDSGPTAVEGTTTSDKEAISEATVEKPEPASSAKVRQEEPTSPGQGRDALKRPDRIVKQAVHISKEKQENSAPKKKKAQTQVSQPKETVSTKLDTIDLDGLDALDMDAF